MGDRGLGIIITLVFFGFIVFGIAAMLGGETGTGWLALVVGVPGAILVGSFLSTGPSARTFFITGFALVVMGIAYLSYTSGNPARLTWWPF